MKVKKNNNWAADIRILFKDFPISEEEVEKAIEYIRETSKDVRNEIILYERARKYIFHIMSKKK